VGRVAVVGPWFLGSYSRGGQWLGAEWRPEGWWERLIKGGTAIRAEA